ncbi:Uncharacterised protein [Acinetobacter baumannii]|nr:Uncharacterised protein [Acinetobacter baumannii]
MEVDHIFICTECNAPAVYIINSSPLIPIKSSPLISIKCGPLSS